MNSRTRKPVIRRFYGYSYCVVDVETQKAEFLKVEIDENQLLKDLVDNGEDKTLISYLKSKMEGI